MSHDKDYSPSASELMAARDAALEALSWSTPTGCDVRAARLPADPTNVEADPHAVTPPNYEVTCYQCGTDCDCAENGWACRDRSESERLPEMMDGLPFYWDDDAKAAMLTELTAFITEETNSDDLHGLDYAQIGHDFILTRNGHGAGFWDRGLGERGDRLTAACKSLGEMYMHADYEAKTYKLGA